VGDYLDRLAAFAEGVRVEALPAATLDAARLVLLDTLGAIAAGSVEKENRRLAELAAARAPGGAATLVGHAAGADAFWAALVNATAGVALEVDEGNRLGGGHPAIHTIPGALALAEERGLRGDALLAGVVAGYEIGSRLGTATTPRANVHSHGTWGTISTAVAAGRLAGLGTPELREVINLAASMSPANTWTPALEGATIRNLYPGRSAFQGLLAIELHRCGFTGLADGPADVYGTLLAERFEPAAALDGLGAGYRIEQNYFKLHACCRYNHPALEALLDLRRTHRLDAGAVARVTVAMFPFGVRMAAPEPATPLAARFSIPYAVAALLVLGRTDPGAFQPPALGDPRVRALARRVEVTIDPDASPRLIDRPAARVTVALTDGRTLAAETRAIRGDAANPVGREEVEAKFLGLAGPVLGEARARAVRDAVARVETLGNVAELGALLRPAPGA
jgi:2-methylcitrate dehydratase PrpD